MTEPSLEPHAYVPSTMHMGDCAVCGHLQGAAIHSSFIAPSRDPRDALRLVLMFHEPFWDDTKIAEWRRITGTTDATTKTLCDHVRATLAHLNLDEGTRAVPLMFRPRWPPVDPRVELADRSGLVAYLKRDLARWGYVLDADDDVRVEDAGIVTVRNKPMKSGRWLFEKMGPDYYGAVGHLELRDVPRS